MPVKTDFKPVKFVPEFVQTKHTRNFEVEMDALALGAGEGRYLVVSGPSGTGKSKTTDYYIARNDSVYLRMQQVWQTNATEFLQELAREVGVTPVPKRKGPCSKAIIERLLFNPRPVFLDELEKLPNAFFEITRDLTDLTGAPFVLVGEEELVACMQRNTRLWTRVQRHLEFGPIKVSDIIFYALKTTGLDLSPSVANIIYKAGRPKITDGNFRVVRRSILALVQMANSFETRVITEKMAVEATRIGLSGDKR